MITSVRAASPRSRLPVPTSILGASALVIVVSAACTSRSAPGPAAGRPTPSSLAVTSSSSVSVTPGDLVGADSSGGGRGAANSPVGGHAGPSRLGLPGSVASSGAITVGGGSAGSATIAGCPLFPADNAWRTDVSSAALDPHSNAWVASIGSGNLHPDFGANADYGIPYVVVAASQPTVPITFTDYGD